MRVSEPKRLEGSGDPDIYQPDEMLEKLNKPEVAAELSACFMTPS